MAHLASCSSNVEALSTYLLWRSFKSFRNSASKDLAIKRVGGVGNVSSGPCLGNRSTGGFFKGYRKDVP